VASLREELKLQKGIVSALLTRIYGAKSEKMSLDQLLMTFLEDEAKKTEAADGQDDPPAAEPSQKKAPKKKARRTNRLIESLEGLPTKKRVIIDPEVEKNPDLFRLLDTTVSVRLHATPATFTRELIERQTHVLKNDPDAIPFTPPLEPCLLPQSVLTPSLGAYLLTQKFCYHSTFYREEWKLKASHGIDLKRNVMCNWHDHLADRLLPLYDLIAERIRMSDYVRIDETPIPCLEPGKGKTATGYFWVYQHAEHGPLFDWHKSRANTCLDQILIGKNGKPSFNGYLQSDGLRAYRTFIERHLELNIIPVSCLTHIRRKFWDARNDHPRISRWIIRQIGKIYRIEKILKKEKAGPLDRQRARWLETRHHYDHLKRLFHHLEKHRRILPKSNLGKALSYARDQWAHLEPCFLDGQIELDNNHTEGAIRPTKLGAKNWMFIGAEETGWRSAVIYTFVEQIRRHQLAPPAYFEWVFEKLMHMCNPTPVELESLLPINWVAGQREAEALRKLASEKSVA
jgi:transposase